MYGLAVTIPRQTTIKNIDKMPQQTCCKKQTREGLNANGNSKKHCCFEIESLFAVCFLPRAC